MGRSIRENVTKFMSEKSAQISVLTADIETVRAELVTEAVPRWRRKTLEHNELVLEAKILLLSEILVNLGRILDESD